ncbi:MAG: hypothetical protein PHY16_00070 [Methylobacter sp.]|nr:hypothetical protein [Methylobacter sp.]
MNPGSWIVCAKRPAARFRHHAKPSIHIHVTGYRHPCRYDGVG